MAWKIENFGKFPWKIRNVFTRIDDPQISNQVYIADCGNPYWVLDSLYNIAENSK